MSAAQKRATRLNRDQRVAGILASIWLVVFLAGAAVIQPWRAEVPLSNDFVSFLTGAALIKEGGGATLYDTGVQARFQADLRMELTGIEAMRTGEILDPFHSPPVQALLLLPLTLLPVPLAYLLFSAGSLLAIFLAVMLPMRGHPWGATATVVMIAFAAVADTLVFGQVNAQFVLALSLALVALRSGRPFVAGGLLGVLWLKPQYALLFPVVFLWKRRWRELGGMFATGFAMAAVSVGLVGVEGALRYGAMMREIGGFYAPPDAFIFPQSMVNWRAVLIHQLPGVSEDVGRLLMLSLGVATYTISLLAWRGPWEPTSPRFPSQVLVLLIASLVASPHTNFHGMVLLLPALVLCLGRRDPASVPDSIFYGLLAVGYLMALVVWPGKPDSWLLVPLFVALMGSLLIYPWPRRIVLAPRVKGDT